MFIGFVRLISFMRCIGLTWFTGFRVYGVSRYMVSKGYRAYRAFGVCRAYEVYGL